jgi:hypothetical protein
MKRTNQKRLRVPPTRNGTGSKREEDDPRPRKRPGWMRDEELDRSINAAVQDSDYSRER